jgi:hypothetical protein
MSTLHKPAQLVELEDKLRNDKGGKTDRNCRISHLIQRGDWTPINFQALEILKQALEKAFFVSIHVKF